MIRRTLLGVLVVGLLLASSIGVFSSTTKGEFASGWGPALRLGNSGDSPYDPKIAVSSCGNAVTVWSAGGTIRARTYIEGSGWTAEAAISGSSYQSYFPDVAIDGKGNATATWGGYVSGFHAMAARYTVGIGWGPPELIDNANVATSSPRVAMDRDGNALAVFALANGSVGNIWANRYDSLSGWGTPVPIQQGGGDANYPALAMDAGGNGTAVWIQLNASRYTVTTNRFEKGSGWTGAVSLEDDELAGATGNLDVAMDSTGSAVAVWTLRTNPWPADLWASVYTPGAGWGNPALIEGSDLPEIGIPDVEMNNGRAMVVFVQGDYGNGSTYNVYANRFVMGVGWESPVLVEHDNANPSYYDQIALDDQGNAVAMWFTQNLSQNFSVGGMELEANRYINGSGWEEPIMLWDMPANFGSNLAMGMDGNGSVTAVWQEFGPMSIRYTWLDGTIDTTDQNGAPKNVFIQGQFVFVNVFISLRGTPLDQLVTVSLERPNGSVFSSFTVRTNDPAMGWYNSSQATSHHALSTNDPMMSDVQTYYVVVRNESTGVELSREAITVLKTGLRLSPEKDSPGYWTGETINVSLVTTHSANVFYVQVLNETGAETGINWTTQTALTGQWDQQFTMPDLPNGTYVMNVRASANSIVWYSVSFRVGKYAPPIANAGSDQILTAGGIVVLDGSGSTDDAGVANWTWNFTYNGLTVTLWGEHPSFQFNQAGVYEIELTVTDITGQVSSDTVTVTVQTVIPEFDPLITAVGMALLFAVLFITRRARVR